MSFGVAILALAVLVLIHEAGHFVVARWVGMRPRKFYLGFGPPIVKRMRGGVEYGVAALPLGGYVKIPGMHRPSAGDLGRSLRPEEQVGLEQRLAVLDLAIEREDDDGAREALAALEPELGGKRAYEEMDGALATDAYWRQTTWRRIAVIAAGPAANVLVAIVIFAIVFMLASSQATRTVERVLDGRPAAAAGLAAGDEIQKIAGVSVAADEISKHIDATEGRPFRIVVVRDGKTVRVGPLRAKLDQGAYRVGFQIAGKSGPGESLPTAVVDSIRLVGTITKLTVTSITGLARGQGTEDVSSAVGIVKVTSQAFQQSAADFLFVVGYISLALALLNLLPVLPLDGGHIVMAVLERVRGRAFSQQVYLRFSAIGLSIFVLLLYFGLRNDLFGAPS